MEEKKIIRVGLTGNPNCGKTTIFNTLTGLRQKVGNYAGVTVEKKEGRKIYKDIEFIIFDLPGVYSLTAYSLDEVVARDFIINEKPDIIIDVIDSTNIERNLYLLLQFQELGIPVVCALNMNDQAEARGIKINEKTLAKILGIPMIKTTATKGIGVDELLDNVIEMYTAHKTSDRKISYGYELESEIDSIVCALNKDKEFAAKYPARWMAIKLLEKDENAIEKLNTHKNIENVSEVIKKSTKIVEDHFGNDSEIVVSEQRYAYVHGAVTEAVTKTIIDKKYLTEMIDKILINRFLGLPIFLFILWGMFQITFKLGEYPMGWLEMFFGFLSEKVSNVMPDGILKSLIVDGVIGGVGGVLSFVPLIVILFLLISILEDTGYMARAAFITDKFLHVFGLHGQSFLPMMIGFGCSVPAIMAARGLKNPRDRIITIMVTPFMSCGAKLPVHVLLAGAFFGANASNMVLIIYLIGVTLALVSAKILRTTVLKGEPTPFVMELPPYRMPTLKGIWFHVSDKTFSYLKKAGTVLLAASIIIWAMITFPQYKFDDAKYAKTAADYVATIDSSEIINKYQNVLNGTVDIAGIEDEGEKADLEEFVTQYKNKEITVEEKVKSVIEQKSASYIEVLQREEALAHSIAGRAGKLIEPLIAPLGFDWKIGISAVTGFAAKEIVVSTLGILYKVGTEESEESESLRNALRQSKTFSPLVAFVLMLFTLTLAPCFAAQATIKAELGWKWLGFYYLFSTGISWTLCFTVYQLGRAFGIGM